VGRGIILNDHEIITWALEQKPSAQAKLSEKLLSENNFEAAVDQAILVDLVQEIFSNSYTFEPFTEDYNLLAGVIRIAYQKGLAELETKVEAAFEEGWDTGYEVRTEEYEAEKEEEE
jgi:hypothetical protein